MKKREKSIIRIGYSGRIRFALVFVSKIHRDTILFRDSEDGRKKLEAKSKSNNVQFQSRHSGNYASRPLRNYALFIPSNVKRILWTILRVMDAEVVKEGRSSMEFIDTLLSSFRDREIVKRIVVSILLPDTVYKTVFQFQSVRNNKIYRRVNRFLNN